MIGQIKNNGLQPPSFFKSGYANAVILTEPDSFAMKIDGTEYAVVHPAHRQDIRDFLSAGGAERKETVAAVLHKGIEPTKENLELVHAALNEDPFQQDPGADIKEEFDAEIIEKLDLPPEVKERIVRSGDLLKAIRTVLAEASVHTEGISSKARNPLTLKEAISALLQHFKAPSSGADMTGFFEPADAGVSDLASSMDEVFTDFASGTASKEGGFKPHFEDRDTGERFVRGESTDFGVQERAGADFSNSAMRFVRSRDAVHSQPGRIEFGPEIPHTGDRVPSDVHTRGARIESASEETVREEEIPQEEIPQDEARQIAELVNQALLMVDSDLRKVFADLEFKTYLVTRTDERMIAAKKEFDEMKTSAIRALDKGSITKTIELLTRSIQKSSFAMLTDMPTEKKLLIGLSRLEEASAALKNKDIQLAEKIVKEVRDLLDRIEFKPSSRKIQTMVAQKVLSAEKSLQEKNLSMQDKVLEAIRLHSSGTARDLLELVRFSGANHEIEKYENSSGVGSLKNLKELFSDSSFSAMMSGEQMLNNSDDQRKRDFYVLDIPLQIDDEIAGLKVFVGGKSDENRLDWRNAELYFALKLGEEKIGLRFSVKDAGVAIEITGDKVLRMENLKEPLAEIGYRLLSVKNSAGSSERRLPLQVGGVQDAVVRERPENKFEAKV